MEMWYLSLDLGPANVKWIWVNMRYLWYTKQYYIILTPRVEIENLQEL